MNFIVSRNRSLSKISLLADLSGKGRGDLDFHFAPAAVADHAEKIETARMANHEDLILRIGEVDEPDFGEPAKGLVAADQFQDDFPFDVARGRNRRATWTGVFPARNGLGN